MKEKVKSETFTEHTNPFHSDKAIFYRTPAVNFIEHIKHSKENILTHQLVIPPLSNQTTTKDEHR